MFEKEEWHQDDILCPIVLANSVHSSVSYETTGSLWVRSHSAHNQAAGLIRFRTRAADSGAGHQNDRWWCSISLKSFQQLGTFAWWSLISCDSLCVLFGGATKHCTLTTGAKFLAALGWQCKPYISNSRTLETGRWFEIKRWTFGLQSLEKANS